MKRAVAVLLAVLLLGGVSAHALWSASDVGRWPETWPKELEPLRKQAKSYTGSSVNRTFHEIQFKSREEFEAAWPHLLKVKDANAPIFLSRPSEVFRAGQERCAGVDGAQSEQAGQESAGGCEE